MSGESRNSAKGLIYAVVSSSTFGLVPLFAIPALKAGVSVNSVVFYRFAISALLVGVVLLAKRESLRIEKRQLPVIAGFAFLYAATSFLLTQSYLYIPSGLATTLHFLYPVLVTILMVVFFKERLSVPVAVATLLALGGIYLLSGSEGGEINPTGMALALTTVLTYASYIVGLNRSSIGRIDSLKLTFYILATGSLFFLANLLVRGEGLAPVPSWTTGIDLFLLALVPTLISNLTLILAVKHIGSTTTAVLGCMELLTAVVMGILFLGESCSLIQAWGIGIILVAVTTVIVARNPEELKKMWQRAPRLLYKRESRMRRRM
ncbi:DMT family transporter [Barnesiella sp. An55]|uniref:EamA family transporter n=1 Tax=Barnesiella sp. An55 TaxID=1965646 RepID=UPI000B39A7B1|nr:DMT family transporter [Barnesiella sp. An55]OUN71954.1 EamA family transporter [Barnesiella sp. An55]